MAVLDNPMAALQAVSSRSTGGTLQSGPTRTVSERHDLGDKCLWEGERFTNLEYDRTVISPDGQRCRIVTFCDGQCNNGKIVATRCNPVAMDTTDCVQEIATLSEILIS